MNGPFGPDPADDWGDGSPDAGDSPPDLGDLVAVLLAMALASLRDRLAHDGYTEAALLVADLVDISDTYITNCMGAPERSP